MNTFRFAGIRIWRATFALRQKFSHNLASRDTVETVIVEIDSSGGCTGYGQALPRAYLTGESIDTVIADIRERWWPALTGMTMREDGTVTDAMRAFRPLYDDADRDRRTASYAAVEVAALDAYTAEKRLPLPPPGPYKAVPLVGVISAGGGRTAYWLAKTLSCMGYRHFKVKVGKDADADGARLEAVRRAVGQDAWLAVDANQAWEADEVVARMEGLRRYNVRLVEEPVTKTAASSIDFAELEKDMGIAIMADETLCTLADARALLGQGGPSWWNVRLAKNGGFSGVSTLAGLARENGIHLYGGILVGETSILAAAGRAAFLENRVECGEYGFPRVFLKGDPFRGGPGGFRGIYAPVEGGNGGLRVSVKKSALDKCGRLVWEKRA